MLQHQPHLGFALLHVRQAGIYERHLSLSLTR
jgi:hypothetical protein